MKNEETVVFFKPQGNTKLHHLKLGRTVLRLAAPKSL